VHCAAGPIRGSPFVGEERPPGVILVARDVSNHVVALGDHDGVAGPVLATKASLCAATTGARARGLSVTAK
jgi:hypothetical protein